VSTHFGRDSVVFVASLDSFFFHVLFLLFASMLNGIPNY